MLRADAWARNRAREVLGLERTVLDRHRVIAYIIGVLVVALGVGLSIGLHEIGHLVPAKKFGVKVTQYMVGFGPTIWSQRKGETEYGVKAIPLGGYIRMIGMFPPKPGDPEGQLRASSTGRFTQLMDQARQDSMDEVQPGEENRVFYQLSVPKKVVVMMGGPVMNLFIAVVLFGGILTLYGIPTTTPLISTVATCVPSTAPTVAQPQPACVAGDPASPAAVAGLQAGDRIVSVNGTAVSTWDQVTPLIRQSAGQTMALVVDRDGSQVTLDGADRRAGPGGLRRQRQGQGRRQRHRGHRDGRLPRRDARPASWSRARSSRCPGSSGTSSRPPPASSSTSRRRWSASSRPPSARASATRTARSRSSAWAGWAARSPAPTSAPTGRSAKIMTLLSLIAALNMALFVFNLIPLLPLDGGHVAGALWEGLKRNGARILGRADPGHVDVAKALPVAYTMAIVLITMSALLIYADIVKPVKLF